MSLIFFWNGVDVEKLYIHLLNWTASEEKTLLSIKLSANIKVIDQNKPWVELNGANTIFFGIRIISEKQRIN